MASILTISGSKPGILDPTQPQRVLRMKDAASTLSFAEYNGGPVPPDVSESLTQVFDVLKTRRIVIETALDGTAHWRFVPGAVLYGVPDEGHWPRVVNFLGEKTVIMSRDQWDVHKLDPAYTCTVDMNMACIWPAGREHAAPISPPNTDSDIKSSRPGVGTRSQPYVVDDPEKSSAPPPLSVPQSEPKMKQNPFAARVSSVSEGEDGGKFMSTEHSGATEPSETTPRSTKRKEHSPMDDDDTHSVISISSDSCTETETPSLRRRPALSTLADDAGPGTPLSSKPRRSHSTSRYKRRRLYSIPNDSSARLKSEPPGPTSLLSPTYPSPTVPPSSKRSRPMSGLSDSPAHKRPRLSPKSTPHHTRDPAYYRPPDASPIRIFLPRRPSSARREHRHFPKTSQSDSDAKTPAQHTKRPASRSPDVEEISGPFAPTAKRQRLHSEEPDLFRKARIVPKQERVQRKATREKARKAARPTASLFGDPNQDPAEADFSAIYGSSFTAYRPVTDDYPSFHTHDSAMGPGQAGPSAPRSDVEYEAGSEDEDAASAASDDHEGDSVAEDDDKEHATAIEESKRKLAELERDRPLWEEAERQRKTREDFERRQKEAEKLREEKRQRERDARQREDEARRRQQERVWERFKYQEKRRPDQETRSGAREDFTDFHSHWSYMYGARSRTVPFGRAATAHQTWTPKDALARYEKQCASFDANKYTSTDMLDLGDIPWPILARSPVSMDHVDWDTVGEFFKTVKGLMSAPDYTLLVDKSHKRWHPDRWRSRTGAFRFIKGTDDQREQVEKKVNMVSQVLTPLWQESR